MPRHVKLIVPNSVEQLEWIFFLMLPIATGCMKASFLFFYMRVFATRERSAINKFLKAFIVFIVVWVVAFFFGMFFECGRNFWAIWNSQVEFQARCSSNMKLILTLCITDFIADVFIICIPIPLVGISVWSAGLWTNTNLGVTVTVIP